MRPPSPSFLPLSARSRVFLAVLAVILVLVEAGPILFEWHYHGIWALKNYETFDWIVWPSLKVAYAPSYFFNESGFYMISVLKLDHWLTSHLTGSRHLSLTYLQCYAYVLRIAYSAGMLTVLAIYCVRKRNLASILLAALVLLSLHLAAPLILDLYHLCIGLPQSYKLFVLVIVFVTLEATDRLLDGRAPTGWHAWGWGSLAGAMFIEAPHYILLVVPLFAIAVISIRRLSAVPLQAIGWLLGGISGFGLGLALFYGRDWTSASAGVATMFHGLVGGFAQPQPGFEQFANMVFDRRSPYFLVQVALALHVVAMAVFVALSGGLWRRLDHRRRLAAFATAASLGLAWCAHLLIWRTHGSYTTVFSLVYCGVLTTALAAHQALQMQKFAKVNMQPLAGAIAAIGLAVPCLLTLLNTDYQRLVSTEVSNSECFRSFNAAVDLLPKPVGLAYNSDLTYFLLGAHYYPGIYLFHYGQNWHGEDGRFSRRIQQDRFPDYQLMFQVRAVEVSYDYQQFKMRQELEVGWPPLAPAATFVPAPAKVASQFAAEVEGDADFVAADNLAPGFDLRRFLLAQPDRGVRWQKFGSPWFIAPLTHPAIRDALVSQSYWPRAWDRQNRAFYLVSTPTGYFILGLQRDLAPPSSPPAATAHSQFGRTEYGKLRLRLRFPVNRIGQAEPIVSTGAEQEGDFIYVIYHDATHIQLAFDHWFVGGPVTAPIPIDLTRDHQLEISLGSLFPPAGDPLFAGMPMARVQELKRTVAVILDGNPVLHAAAASFDSNPRQVTVGRNLIKGSSCSPAFTGTIIQADRIWPDAN